MQISRIRRSDKTSRLHPRHVAPQTGQTNETQSLVEVRVWIILVPDASNLVLVAQPPTQPNCGVAVERTIRAADGTYRAKRKVQQNQPVPTLTPALSLKGEGGFLDQDQLSVVAPRGLLR